MSTEESLSARAAASPAVAAPPRPRAPLPEERSSLLRWLDRGLREGRSGRLEAEYPASLGRGECRDHKAIFIEGRAVAHAMVHVVSARSHGRSLEVGMLGLVYTEQRWRGRGLARLCVEACCSELRLRGVPLAALWSDQHAFYERLGFLPAGFEACYRVTAQQCQLARSRLRSRARRVSLEVSGVRDSEWRALEDLYDKKPARAERERGSLQLLAHAPETRVVVARKGRRPVAYAALGRGDDFQGVVHEWAGSASGILACLEALCRERGELKWLCGPVDEAPAPMLRAVGVRPEEGFFALARVLDETELWRRLARRRGAGAPDLCAPEWLELAFGRGLSSSLSAKLSAAQGLRVSAELPFPLYLWGFDSI